MFWDIYLTVWNTTKCLTQVTHDKKVNLRKTLNKTCSLAILTTNMLIFASLQIFLFSNSTKCALLTKWIVFIWHFSPHHDHPKCVWHVVVACLLLWTFVIRMDRWIFRDWGNKSWILSCYLWQLAYTLEIIFTAASEFCWLNKTNQSQVSGGERDTT